VVVEKAPLAEARNERQVIGGFGLRRVGVDLIGLNGAHCFFVFHVLVF